MLFPIAALASVIGVALWPLVYAGWLGFYPGEAHARIMVQGFVGGFALGFLVTAFPKMTGSPSLNRYELVGFVLLQLACWIAHAGNFILVGDWCFLLLWVGVLHSFGVRLAFFRSSLPPPGFVLAAMGILGGLVGVVLLLVGRVIVLSDFQRSLAQLLLNEAFILGPLVGIGGFLFPRFFVSEQGDRPGLPWALRARRYFLLGCLLAATFFFQATGSMTVAPIARAVIVAVVIVAQLPILRWRATTGTLSSMLRLGLIFLIGGIGVVGLAPVGIGVDVKHLLFIGGYGMVILAVASRVTWGHSGNIDLAEGVRRVLRVMIGILLMALATRVVAGFIPTIRVSHHIYAALLWIVAVAVWGVGVLKFVRVADPDDD